MSDIILHHFDLSPFAEKVRVALGIKGLAWRSVQIPMVMPKPDLTLLTGGYRKTPVMQIGADIYCDTRRIARELEHRFGGASLFADAGEALCQTVAAWSDQNLFRPGAGLSMATNLDLPEAILADRFAFFDFLNRDTLPDQADTLFAQFRANLQCVEDMLAQAGPYLFGDAPTWADAACYAPVWMCRGNIQGAASLLETLPLIQAWEQRMLALGQGQCEGISAEESHAVAQASTSIAEAELSACSLPRLELNDRVRVTPDDYGAVPVEGALLRLTQHDIAIRRESERTGALVVHFPRTGYRLERG